uniref:Phosphoglycerate mutase n=1 Tax=Calcidiscus leptoporus TaxID=127549 RepID=A0A7S0P022_9EUKA|mmetsp:Transcript_40624/g.94844  ORF Transcript_40624/g.94844 Transcript_40624/m.94844 type:complete len:130 (+) Transcript_40624:277-666(+)
MIGRAHRSIEAQLAAFSLVRSLLVVDLRERCRCDEGRPKKELVKLIPEMAGWGGFKEMPEEWWCKKFVESDFNDRIDKLLSFIASRPEQTIAVVGHGGLFTRILGVHLKNCGYTWVDFKRPASDDVEMV